MTRQRTQILAPRRHRLLAHHRHLRPLPALLAHHQNPLLQARHENLPYANSDRLTEVYLIITTM